MDWEGKSATSIMLSKLFFGIDNMWENT